METHKISKFDSVPDMDLMHDLKNLTKFRRQFPEDDYPTVVLKKDDSRYNSEACKNTISKAFNSLFSQRSFPICS